MQPDEPQTTISCTVNGTLRHATVSVRHSLAQFLRETLSLTGTHVGCEHGVCGACNVRLDGRVVRACLIFAAQVDGQQIETIEHTGSPQVKALQAAFFERAALQCGFCTPGMIMQASELLATNPAPSREEIREHLSGNFCRCTGYHAIVDAVHNAAQSLEAAVAEGK